MYLSLCSLWPVVFFFVVSLSDLGICVILTSLKEFGRAPYISVFLNNLRRTVYRSFNICRMLLKIHLVGDLFFS